MARTYSKTTMPGFIRLKLGETGSGSRRHRVHTWTGLRRVQTWDPSENLWDVLEEPLQSAQTQPSSVQKLLHWMEMNPVTLQTLMGTMPQPACAVIKARGGPTNIRVCDLFFYGQAVCVLFGRTSCSSCGCCRLQFTNVCASVETWNFRGICFCSFLYIYIWIWMYVW